MSREKIIETDEDLIEKVTPILDEVYRQIFILKHQCGVRDFEGSYKIKSGDDSFKVKFKDNKVHVTVERGR